LYTHKKQSGGAGQYARVAGYVEPMEEGTPPEFVNQIVGNAIPPSYIPACEKVRARIATQTEKERETHPSFLKHGRSE
jgi:translation elongation factor EF-G